MQDRKLRQLVGLASIALAAALAARPAAAQPTVPLWCSADPRSPQAVPFRAPTWTELGSSTPDYVTVTNNFRVSQSLRLLISALEKGLQQVAEGKSLANAPDVDGVCLCNCGRDAASWVGFLQTTVKDEAADALRKTEDRYLRGLDAQLGKALETLVTTVPTFAANLQDILTNACNDVDHPTICAPKEPNAIRSDLLKQAASAANDQLETIFKTPLADIRVLVVDPPNLRSRLEDLRAKVQGVLAVLSSGDAASILAQRGSVEQILADAKSIIADVEAASLALGAAYKEIDLKGWTSDIGQALKAQLDATQSSDAQLWTKVQAEIEAAIRARVQDVKAAGQGVYDTAVDFHSSLDDFTRSFTQGVVDDLTQVAGCYGVTKRSACTVDDTVQPPGFCAGTPPGALLGQPELALPMWYPTEVFKNGKSALLYALETIDWLDKVKHLAESNAPSNLVAGGTKLLDVLKNGKDLIDTLSKYVDKFTGGYHLGTYSNMRRDLRPCVAYGGSGTFAELFELDLGAKHVRGGANYLSANLAAKHDAQLMLGGFALDIDGRQLPLAPGLSLDFQMEGFRFWDETHPFGLAGPRLSTQDVGAYDIFNLVDRKEVEDNLCTAGTAPCNPLVTALYKAYFPIHYNLGGTTHDWPRQGVPFDQDATLSAVFGGGLDLDLEMKTYRWSTDPFTVFPGVFVTPWLTLDAGVEWVYKANRLRSTLLDSINKNLPPASRLDVTGFDRDRQALQSQDYTDDRAAGAHVNPKLGADVTVGLDLARWLRVGITADLYVGVDVAASGFGGVLDLNRALVETLAVSNPPGGDCKPVVQEAVTRVCSNTSFQRPNLCPPGATDCVQPPPPSSVPIASGSKKTYVCSGDGPQCGDYGYCVDNAGGAALQDTTRAQCEVPSSTTAGWLAVRMSLSPPSAGRSIFLPSPPSFFPYQCVSQSRPQVTGYTGADCNPIEYGYPSACGAQNQDPGCACEPATPGTCAAGRTCVEGGCLKTCSGAASCDAGQACQSGVCVMANGLPFAEQIVWRMRNVDRPRYSIASYALDRLITSAVLGLGVTVGMDYRLFRTWRHKSLLDFHQDVPLLSLPFVKHQLGLEARYQDDCDSTVGSVTNHQPDSIKRPPPVGTPAELVAWCKPQMAGDVQNPAAPQDLQPVIHQGLDDTFKFGVNLGGDYWQRAQVCVGGVRWDEYLQGLHANPAQLWPLLHCTYGDQRLRQDLDCSGPAVLESSLLAALGCLDTANADPSLGLSRQLRAVLQQLGQTSNWLGHYTPRMGGTPIGPQREVLDLSKLLLDPQQRPLFFGGNLQPSFRALDLEGKQPDPALPRFSVISWLAVLDACGADAPAGRFNDALLAMDLNLSAGDFKPCAGACCSAGACAEVAGQADCAGAFQPARTCADVARGGGCGAQAGASSGDGACFLFGRCQEVLSANQCQGAFFVKGAKCGGSETAGLCSRDADCAAGSWCRDSGHGGPRCTPLVGEGDRCAGNVPAELFERCGPGLFCAPVEPTGDIPGICRRFCAAQPPGMAAWWAFDETAGTIAADHLGQDDGLYHGAPTPVPGMVGGALEFDGVKDYVEVPDGLDLRFGTGDLSIVTWLRADAAGGVQSILDKRGAGAGYHLYLYLGRLGLQLADGTYSNYASNAAVADGQWHQVAVTVERGLADGIRWYVDGREVGPRADPTGHRGPLDSTAPLRLATRTVSPDGFWKGALDELALFSRALTADEVAALALARQAGICSCAAAPRRLVAWWPLDETPDFFNDVVGDAAGNSPGLRVGGPQLVAGQVRGAVSFDGVHSYVEVASTKALGFGAGDLSIEGWLRTAESTGVQSILDKRTGGAGYHLFLSRGRLGLQLADGSGYTNFGSQALVADGAWHHFAVTVARRDAQGIRWYLDGEEVAPRSDPTVRPGSLDSAAPLRMAVRSFSLTGFWNGTLDELSLYDRILLPREVRSIYRAQAAGKCAVGRPLTPFPP